MSNVHQVLIIGSGPAGYTAAIYSARANLRPILFTGPQPGGQLTITTEVDNYPGFAEGIMGPEMMTILKRQAERFGTQIIEEQITRVDFSESPFKIYQGNEIHLSKTVIIATGASAKLLHLPSEKALMGHGVSACATCDGFFYRGKEVVVIGGGDTAMEEAHFLTKFAKQVTVIHRRDSLRASKIMQDRALNNPKIKFIWNHEVDEIVGEQTTGVTGIRIKNTQTHTLSLVACDGVFIAIGHQPNSQLFKDYITRDAHDYIIVDKGSSKTNIPGVFACGDVADAVYRQAITAAGTGCMAAIDAERFLNH